ncbi:unnamed protein product, partial [marine sediment metagenome]
MEEKSTQPVRKKRKKKHSQVAVMTPLQKAQFKHLCQWVAQAQNDIFHKIVQFSDYRQYGHMATLTGHTDDVTALDFTRDSRKLASSSKVG